MLRKLCFLMIVSLVLLAGCGGDNGTGGGGGGIPLPFLLFKIHYRPSNADLRSGCQNGVALTGNLTLAQQVPGDNKLECFSDQMRLIGDLVNEDREYLIAILEHGQPQKRILNRVFVEITNNGRGEVELTRHVTSEGKEFLWFKIHKAPNEAQQADAYVEP